MSAIKPVCRTWPALFLAVMVSACGGLPWLRSLPELPLLPPADFAPSIPAQGLQFSEQITMTNADGEQTLLAAWVVTANRLTLVGLSPTGQRLLTIEYDGQTLREDYSDLLPEAIPGRYILSHLQLAHWPAHSIAAAFAGTDWRLQAIDDERQVFLHDRLAMTINRQANVIDIESPLMNYALRVRQLTASGND